MVIDGDPNDSDWNSRYRNPLPPPGYVKQNLQIIIPPITDYDKLWNDVTECVVEEGIPDDSDLDKLDFFAECPISDPDDEVTTIHVEPKIPELVDLELDSPCSPEVGCPVLEEAPKLSPPASILVKSVKKNTIKSSLKHHRKSKKEIEVNDDSDNSTYLSDNHQSRKKLKKHKKLKHDSSSLKRRHKSRSMSPKAICSPRRRRRSMSRSPKTDNCGDYEVKSKYKMDFETCKKDYEEIYRKNEFMKKEVDVKPEIYVSSTYNIFGSYYCEICKSSMTSQQTWEAHIVGKKHQKILKARNPLAVVSQSMPSAPSRSRYPLAPKGIIRSRVHNGIAGIQGHIETNRRIPTPGLSKVIEIYGIDKVFYYCGICDLECSSYSIISHLEGFKHRMNILKMYETKLYERFRIKKKSEIDLMVTQVLNNIEKKNGFEKMTVERELRNETGGNVYNNWRDTNRDTYRTDMPGPSSRPDDFQDIYSRSIQPDTSKADFYCVLCNSHMNSEQMWQSHIVGSRHIKNLKKPPGEAPSKVKSIKLIGVRARLQDRIDAQGLTVIGLNAIRETRNSLTNGVQYNCFLCGSCLTHLDVIDHLLTVKHRTKYLESIDHKDYLQMSRMGMQEKYYWSVIDEFTEEVFLQEGSGEVEVFEIKRS